MQIDLYVLVHDARAIQARGTAQDTTYRTSVDVTIIYMDASTIYNLDCHLYRSKSFCSIVVE